MSRDVTRRSLLIGSAGAVVSPLLIGPAQATTRENTNGSWQSELVHDDGQGRLIYTRDDEGNRIPDFSYAGHRNGEEPIPNVATVLTIGPVDGDNTAHIQAAIDQVGALPTDADGIRGAVLLTAGRYDVAGTVHINHHGVVLRGVGDGEDPGSNTVIHAVGNEPPQRNVLEVGGGLHDPWYSAEVPGTRTDILTGLVAVGDRAFVVKDPSGLAAGDQVIIVHPCTQEWLDAVDGGGLVDLPPWAIDSYPIVYNRYITAMRGRQVTIDVPVFNHLRRDLAQCHVYKWSGSAITQVGVEDLRVDIEFDGDPDQDEEHAHHAIRLAQAEDVWVRGCTMLHFIQSGVAVASTTRATIVNCRALDPVSRIIGSRRYNFMASGGAQQVLFANCYANRGRHAFAANGVPSISDVVFLRNVAEESLGPSGPHQRWNQGILFDNHHEVDPVTASPLEFRNRADSGTGHGWTAAHSVAWNTDLAGSTLRLDRPPTAQNYAIGCSAGQIAAGAFGYLGPGYIDGTNQSGLTPESLYDAQLADRLQ